MLQLASPDLRLDLLDPADPADAARQGSRYCWGGYIWQVYDRRVGPLVSGPEFPAADPTPFNGQGLPESFRHRTREGRPLTWRGREGIAVGAGRLTADDKGGVTLIEPCAWTVTRLPGQWVFQTRDAHAGLAYELTRQVELHGRIVSSRSQLSNVGEQVLHLQWFAHPFWALTGGRARMRLPAGTTLPENPGFALAPDGTLTFRRPFLTATDHQFALLALPAGRQLDVSLDHPRIAGLTFTTSFAPDECPVWANAHTVSVEPYLNLRLDPGTTRHWSVQHHFNPP